MYLHQTIVILAGLVSIALAKSIKEKSTATRCFTYLGTRTVAQVLYHTDTSTGACTDPATVTTTVTKSVAKGTATETDITTVDGGTFTVTVDPTYSAFLPIDRTLPDASYDGSAGNDTEVVKPNQMHRGSFLLPGVAHPQYATAVSCQELVAADKCTSTETSTTVSTTGAATTVTSTSTTTSYTSTTTAYAACASNNLANKYKHQAIEKIQAVSSDGTTGLESSVLGSTDSAADCCVQTITNFSNTAFFAFIEDANTAQELGGNCISYVFDSKCRDEQDTFKLEVLTGDEASGQVVIGNLECAKFVTGSAVPTTTTTSHISSVSANSSN